jgi:hypothetical protein
MPKAMNTLNSRKQVKNKLLMGLLLLMPLFALSQKIPRQILHGVIIADSLKVDNLSVRNITSNIGAVTDDQGSFTIYARPTDTLFFSSITFRSMHLVLKEHDFLEKPLVIRLDVNVTMLDEVIITPSVLSGQLDKDSKNTKTMTINSQFNSGSIVKSDVPRPKAPVNTAMPSTASSLQGVNFIAIYDLIFSRRKKKDRGEIYDSAPKKTFTESVKERFTHHFFTEMLKIPHDEIGLFLNFCDKGKDTAWLLDPKNEFELTDYLVAKSNEYLKKEK